MNKKGKNKQKISTMNNNKKKVGENLAFGRQFGVKWNVIAKYIVANYYHILY